MSLKKSDKIIAVVGVIIIIVAIAGILFYFETEDDVDKDGAPKEEIQYKVEWAEYDDELPTIEGFAGKSGPYTESIVINLEEGYILKNVDIQVTWNDHHYSKFSLPSRDCKDTLNAEFTLTGGDTQSVPPTKGSGNESVHFLINKIDPVDEIIEDAEDIYDAEEIIKNEYYGMNSANFDVNVKITTGESQLLLKLRPIKILYSLLDKGDDFKILVTYSYYKPDVQEIKTNGGGGGNNDDDTSTSFNAITGIYTSTNYALTKH